MAAKVNKENEKKYNAWDDMVSILIPRLQGSKDQPDVIASVNGRVFQIQRGVRVDVPKPIAEVINRSLDFEIEAEDYYFNNSRQD